MRHYFQFYQSAIEVSLKLQDWESALAYCDRLEQYTAKEPLGWCEHVIILGRTKAK